MRGGKYFLEKITRAKYALRCTFLRAWLFGGIIISIIFIAFDMVHFPLSIACLMWFAIAIISGLLNGRLSQAVYKQEKLSVLLPYEYLSSIFTIIVAYLYFGDASFVSFCMALVACIVIIIFALDGKKLVLPCNFWLVILSQALGALRAISNGKVILLIAGYIADNHMLGSASSSFFTLNTLFSTLLLLPTIFYHKDYSGLAQASKSFYIYRFAGAFIGQWGALLGFFVLAKFGVLLSSLFGFLTMGVRMLLGYFILKDVPTKKDITLSIILGIIVAIGFIYK